MKTTANTTAASADDSSRLSASQMQVAACQPQSQVSSN